VTLRTRDKMVSVDELTDDAIAGTYRLFQRKAGHRFSVDDVATAWIAARAVPEAKRVLDLGTGITSVLSMLAWKLSAATFVGIEAQEQSFALAQRNVARNALDGRVTLLHGDIRDVATLDRALADGPFDLVSGTPPYAPPGTATPSPDSQRAHARVELRGGVEVYVAAMARTLAPGGLGVVCADARRPERIEKAAGEHGLFVHARRDVVPRAPRAALFTVWTLGRVEAPFVLEPPLVVRDADGVRTAEARSMRAFFDVPERDSA